MNQERSLRLSDILNHQHTYIEDVVFPSDNTIYPGLHDGIRHEPLDLRHTHWPIGSYRWLGYLSDALGEREYVAAMEEFGCGIFVSHLGMQYLGATTLTLQDISLKAVQYGLREDYGGGVEMIRAIHREYGFHSCEEITVDHPLNLRLQPHQIAYTTITNQVTADGYDSHWIAILPHETLRSRGKLLIADSEWGEPLSPDKNIVRTMGLLVLGRRAIDASFFDVKEDIPSEGYTVLEPPKTIFLGRMLVYSP